jgi:lipopolysaccharide assembly outer membrane protein LptD (OstA)
MGFFRSALYPSLFRPAQGEPVKISAGKTTVKMTSMREFQQTILENQNRIMPNIIQGQNSLKAETIIYNGQQEIGYAYRNVVFEDKENNAVLTAGEGTYYTQERKVVVERNPKLLMRNDNTVATSRTMTFYQDLDYAVLSGNVEIKGADYTMRGDRARLYQNTGKFLMTGKAQTEDDDKILVADSIDIRTKDNRLENYTASGNVSVTSKTEGFIIQSGRLDYYEELGYSRITRNPKIIFKERNIVAYSRVMEKYDAENKANLLGDVVIVQGDRRAYAKWGEYLINEEKVILTGNPVLIEGNSRFNAFQIVVDVKSETMHMIGGGRGLFYYEGN